ncbi:MAG: hypothetical protein F6K62_02145 [Sphaerospermopsis sp. SIO1G2]|nr:hypothetical protein [Sphaerospermopsis sp. SIO1G2]
MNALTSFESGDVFDGSSITANDGGTILLSNLTTLAEVDITSNASIVSLPALTSYSDLGSSYNTVTQAINGGTLTLGGNNSLILSGEDIDISASGANSTIDMNALTSFESGDVFDGSSITANDGGTILLSNLTTLAEVDITSDASVLSLPALTSYSDLGSSYSTVAQALDGGLLDLSNLISIPDGTISFTADGTNSIVDISSLVDSFTNLEIDERNGGVVRR